jgi:predicted ATPase
MRLDAAWAGRGRLVVLIREAGAGKSRLVSELTALATGRQGRVRCYETERVLPFAPWVDGLRTGRVVEERDILDALEPGWRDELGRLLPEISGQGDRTALPPGTEIAGRSGGGPRYPFEAISQLLKRLARRQPTVVVLEDAHWADEMSVRLLAFVGRRLHEVPLLVVATIREEELADIGLLRQSLNELDESGKLLQLAVPSLPRADTVALVQALAPPALSIQFVVHVAQDVWRVSDGNPFVVVEVMHALREGKQSHWHTTNGTSTSASSYGKTSTRWGASPI